MYFKCILIINNDDNLIAGNILFHRFQISNNILITILHYFKFELHISSHAGAQQTSIQTRADVGDTSVTLAAFSGLDS